MSTVTADCYDQKSVNGTIWLDEYGRACKYYRLFTDTCNLNTNTTSQQNDPNWACCACQGKISIPLNNALNEPIWSIVVVAFCLLLIVILSCSLYFVCHLYRNEKKNNVRLLKSKTLSRGNGMRTQSIISKSDISKNDDLHDDMDDDYAAIPGDIGIGKTKQKQKQNDDDMYRDQSPKSSTFKIRPSSFRVTATAITAHNNNNNTTNNNNNNEIIHNENHSTHNEPIHANETRPTPENNITSNENTENTIEINDDYAAIDNAAINKYAQNAQDIKDINNIKTEIFRENKKYKTPQTIALKSSKDSNEHNKNEKAYKQSNNIRRRYSAELEFNGKLPMKHNNFHANGTRKRHSSRFQHTARQTQDDMIFLSYENYLQETDDGYTMKYDYTTSKSQLSDIKDEKNDDYKDIVPDLLTFDYNNNNQKNQKRSSHRLRSKEQFTRISTRRVVKLYAPPEIKYSEIDFTNQKFIGKGSFGAVVRARYHEIDVAVKKLHRQKLTGHELMNFKREAAIMQKVGGHKHIARMYGFCTKPEICIVTEYYGRGSLYDIIKKRKKSQNNLSVELKIQMSIEASLGIWHLHKQQVIHRDISARNLLVDTNWTVVVADLGMSRLKSNIVIKSNIGPVKWMAPESIIGHEYSEKSDSYSFGITIYEIFSGSEPYPGLLPLEAGAKVVHEGLRPSVDKNKKIINVPNLIKLLTMLWKPQPKDRPDFLFITQALKKIKKQWLIKKSKYKPHTH